MQFLLEERLRISVKRVIKPPEYVDAKQIVFILYIVQGVYLMSIKDNIVCSALLHRLLVLLKITSLRQF